jgi:ABC-2 type transport system permease protein
VSMRALRAYPTLLRVGVADAVAYRAEFVVWMLSMTLPLIMLALWSAIAREAPVGRFDQAAFVAYYLATLVVRQLASSWVFWELNREIREGSLALRLLRPIHPLLTYSAEGLAAVPLRAAVSLPATLLLLFTVGGSHVTHDPVRWLLFAISLVGAFVLSFAIGCIVGTLSLYLESAIGIWQLWMGSYALLSGYLVPLELFGPRLERVTRALPFSYLQAVPVEILLGLRSRTEALVGLLGQWGYALFFVILLLATWKQAERRFAAFGG